MCVFLCVDTFYDLSMLLAAVVEAPTSGQASTAYAKQPRLTHAAASARRLQSESLNLHKTAQRQHFSFLADFFLIYFLLSPQRTA